MSTQLVGLAVLMALATYPWRAIPLLAAGRGRVGPEVEAYLRLVGPAVLASLAALGVAITVAADGERTLHVGVEWLAVAACVVVVAWRRSLLAGLLLAVALVAGARVVGLGG